MNKNKLLLLAMMLLPWFSLPLIGRKAVRRYWPGALFICLFVAVESAVAHKKRWWLFLEKFHPKLLGEIPLIAGPFFITSIWVMKLTFGRFWRYLLTNTLADFLFAFLGTSLLRHMGLAVLIRMKKYQFWAIVVFKAILLYGFQAAAELVKSKRHPENIVKRIF